MHKSMSIEIKTLIKTLSFSLVLALITGTIVYSTSLNESLLSALGKIILIITIFSGGCLASKSHGNKGLFRGLTMGTAYFILILAATLVFVPSLLKLSSVIYTLLISLAAGSLGGILGIGLADI
ncbi:MAG TPA: TIGR04086 family membrane protein [Syntrophomonadaceae bacterium]|nr:TIGR04086 family membrane protein [Syntrophomonadaceae bacterium]HPR93734.1 TIGR04086 family membrane protein [Syntrophomonadaceae bacterium]